MDITGIVLIVIAVISAVISAFLIPYLKEKFNQAQRQQIKEWIDVAVKAAEQIFKSESGEKLGRERLLYVADYLETKGITFDVDDVYDEIRLMIESAVKDFAN